MKIFKRTMLILISVLVAATVFVLLYLQLPKLGKAPSGERLEKISRSPHYKDGSFVNLSPTPTLAEGFRMVKSGTISFSNRIIEKDWNETVDLDNGLKIFHC